RVVGVPAARPVVRGTDADEDRTQVLMAEIELDLLERALDEERPVRVHERAQPGQRHAGGGADHGLLADAHVYDPVRMPASEAGEPVHGDVGKHNRRAWLEVHELGDGLYELLAHPYSLGSTVATTAVGRPGRWALRARVSLSWSRPSTVVTAQPSAENRCARPPGQPSDDEELSTTTTVSRSSFAAGAT